MLADLNLLVKGILDVHKAILLLLFHLEPVIIKLVHDPSLHLLRLKFQVFPDKLLLLKEPELFSLLELADVLSNLALGFRSELLPQRIYLPLVRFLNLVNLLDLASPEGLSDYLDFEFTGMLRLLLGTLGVCLALSCGHRVVGEA